jgi:hypothetical protein
LRRARPTRDVLGRGLRRLHLRLTGRSIFIAAAPGGIPFFLQRTDIPRHASQLIHLDLTAAPGRREAEVERLTALGAVRQWDVIGEVPWVDWTTLADPEGNLFCVAEHH